MQGNRDAQLKFRIDWATEQFENYVITKKKITTLTKTTWRKGQYMPLGRIVHKEGGGKLGWMQGVRYMTQTMQLGPPWVVFDVGTKSLRALYVTEGVNTEFTEAWTRFEQWTSDSIESDAMQNRRLEGILDLWAY